jgi:hypothetical protein
VILRRPALNQPEYYGLHWKILSHLSRAFPSDQYKAEESLSFIPCIGQTTQQCILGKASSHTHTFLAYSHSSSRITTHRSNEIMDHSSNRIMAVDFLPYFVVFAAANNPTHWSRQLASFISLARKTQFEGFLNTVDHVRKDGDLYVLPIGNSVSQALVIWGPGFTIYRGCEYV